MLCAQSARIAFMAFTKPLTHRTVTSAISPQLQGLSPSSKASGTHFAEATAAHKLLFYKLVRPISVPRQAMRVKDRTRELKVSGQVTEERERKREAAMEGDSWTWRGREGQRERAVHHTSSTFHSNPAHVGAKDWQRLPYSRPPRPSASHVCRHMGCVRACDHLPLHLVQVQAASILHVHGPLNLRPLQVPTFTEYAKHLREHVPELFSGEFKVLTEFGQSMNAKCGFLASRIEWMKGTPERPIAIIHFGADCCPRQAYTPDHPRRFEAYQEDGAAYPVQSEDTCVATGVGGPLCFQGDFLAKGVALPRALHAGDILVMKDAGANTLSLFSRHCSRLCPPVYGYRWTDDSQSEVSEIQELKPRETMQELSDFWGPL